MRKFMDRNKDLFFVVWKPFGKEEKKSGVKSGYIYRSSISQMN